MLVTKESFSVGLVYGFCPHDKGSLHLQILFLLRESGNENASWPPCPWLLNVRGLQQGLSGNKSFSNLSGCHELDRKAVGFSPRKPW